MRGFTIPGVHQRSSEVFGIKVKRHPSGLIILSKSPGLSIDAREHKGSHCPYYNTAYTA